MAYTFHHVHLKGPDPRKTAQWYAENFGAKILGESDSRGALFVRTELSGVLINISGPRPGEQPGKGDANIHYGLEHFGISTTDLKGDLERLTKKGVKVLQPLLEMPNGAKISFIQGPDDVRIELLQPAP